MKDCGVWKGGEVITDQGENTWRLTQATLPDTSQTLPFSPPHPPFLLTIIVTLAEQLQESEQVSVNSSPAMTFSPGWKKGVRHGPEDIRCAKTPESVHTACCTLHTHAQKQVRRSSSHHFKDTMRAMGIHDTGKSQPQESRTSAGH